MRQIKLKNIMLFTSIVDAVVGNYRLNIMTVLIHAIMNTEPELKDSTTNFDDGLFDYYFFIFLISGVVRKISLQ